MATTTFLSLRPTGIRACASPNPHHQRPDTNRRRRITSTSSSSSSCWTPLFGWSSDPDYIDSNNDPDPSDKTRSRPESEADTTRSRSRFASGCFTEEKAKQLRMKTVESATFHDIMYHSAIASRLASDLPNRSNL
ncbi:hypothetical protein HHK36_014000 [Tetracentron sinense]|uniref:Uncharacterized protein n=1 Tax=Tetracentron sinense TaxID=13715 RepID=A0A834Z591_TETSI|nr:hypothetical protein HHK36_014000 [Tetracentron sinense]